jgi:hypothetical protein
LLIIKNSIEGGSVYAKDLLVKLSQWKVNIWQR